VATTWLDRCYGPNAPKGGAPLPLFLKAGGQFHPPADLLGADMIMVGPGTGVAPFRGFLQARRAAIKANPAQTPGQAWLFFGCRHRDQDYLYKEELEAMAEDGTISHLVTAFSREEGEKMYVQHRMLEHAEALVKLVMGGAYFYVCGDGGQMAKDVNNTLVTILEKHSGLKEKDVSMHVRTMTTEGKYVRDIWS
jgi:NADPH-ferrihemoprotein reductase